MFSNDRARSGPGAVVAVRTAFARIREEFQPTCEIGDKRRDLHSLTSRSMPTAATNGSSCRRHCIRQLVFDRAVNEFDAEVMSDTAVLLKHCCSDYLMIILTLFKILIQFKYNLKSFN